jgi:hypothetical protein
VALWRLTQEVIEVAEQTTYAGGNTARLTQIAVEVAEQTAVWRLTQEVVEVAEAVSYAGGNRVRLTQIAVEVPIVNPLDPFELPPPMFYPEWSPADVAPAEEGPNAFLSYFGPSVGRSELGVRRRWLRTLVR